MIPPADPVRLAIEYTIRQDRGRLIAALTAVIGDFEMAEECLQDAIVAALKDWPANGIPKSRRGWLLQVARHRALDRFRRAKNMTQKAVQIAVLEQAESDAPDDPHDVSDHRLRLIFTCCHPALDEKTRIALTLRSIGGLTTNEVARAFLDQPATMGQRLSRARAKISKAKIGFVIPDGEALFERTASVFRVIYLMFNEGYAVTKGAEPVRIDLCEEAIFLARLMVHLCPDTPEASGLLSLLLLTHSRRAARYNAGKYVPLSDQDRSRWNIGQIEEGQRIIKAVLTQGQLGAYQLQATIAVLHCEAKTAADTDWAQIAALYRLLEQVEPNAIVRLNLAVAVSYAQGPDVALKLLQPLAKELANYQPYHAARADVLSRLGDQDQASVAYAKAVLLSNSDAERGYLMSQLNDAAHRSQPLGSWV